MIRDIIKADTEDNTNFLKTRSNLSIIKEDKQIYKDLLDTAEHYKEYCVGLAAVQIGYHKRAIVVLINDNFELFINPIILHKSPTTYKTEEGCLSLEGTRTVTRHRTVEVMWTTINNKTRKQTFIGSTAQILQHEIDHCNGVLI